MSKQPLTWCQEPCKVAEYKENLLACVSDAVRHLSEGMDPVEAASLALVCGTTFEVEVSQAETIAQSTKSMLNDVQNQAVDQYIEAANEFCTLTEEQITELESFKY